MLKRYILAAMAAGVVWAATPAFEVASVKPALPSDMVQVMHGNARIGITYDAARVDIANLTLMDMVLIAYGAKPYQIVAPGWMKGAQRWDVQATLPKGATPSEAPAMLQTLLRDRFKLTVHREQKEHAVYALLVSKGGPKVKEASPLASRSSDAGKARGMEINDGAKSIFLTGEALGPVHVSPLPGGGGMRLEALKASMAAVADMLSRIVDRPVVDMTGLKGEYEVALDLTPENMRAMMTASGFAMPGPGGHGPEGGTDSSLTGAGATIFQSVQELGLRLEARKAPMEMLVIDHAEKSPTEN